jgi:hypothetical protein
MPSLALPLELPIFLAPFLQDLFDIFEHMTKITPFELILLTNS